MRKALIASLVVVFGIRFASADEFTVDEAHVGATFKISHLGLSWTFGRFNDVSGAFRLDADPAKSAFVLNIKTESLDTANKKRDDHLRSPDFFNAAQYPFITFKSTAVKKVDDGYEVTGDLSLHGVSKSKTLSLKGGKVMEFPKGVTRTGFTADVTLKRSEFGMDKMLGPVGDDVVVSVSFEGVKK